MDSYQVSTVDVLESLIAAAQEVHDSSSSVTPCIVMKNDEVLNHQVFHAVPEIIGYYNNVLLQFSSKNVALVL